MQVAIAFAAQVVAALAVTTSFGLAIAAFILATIRLVTTSIAVGNASNAYDASKANEAAKAAQYEASKTALIAAKAARDVAFPKIAIEEAKVSLAKDAFKQAMEAEDTAEDALNALEDQLRDLEVELKDCLERKAAMEL